jgi:REP element-mobilizing transposase RayT
MPRARKFLIDDNRPGCFHLISRCVRRAWLCADDAEPRRSWVRDLVREAADAFAIEVLAYAVMSNHLHLVVRSDPERVLGWTAGEVVRRWAGAHPRLGRDGTPVAWTAEELTQRANDGAWVAKTRPRLRSVSWFMKCVKERLARRANRADGCTGHFWEGRFRSVALLDQAALIACMAYVDLNPVRAAIADRPENSDYTSAQERIAARQEHRRAGALLDEAGQAGAVPLAPALRAVAEARRRAGPEAGLWLAPIARATGDGRNPPLLELDDYLTLVDETGRIIRSGRRGAIPARLAPILDRLQLDLDAWLDLMRRGGSFLGGAFGHLAERTSEAIRRGVKWIVDITCGLYRDPEPHTA